MLQSYTGNFKLIDRLVYNRPDGVKYLLHAPPSRSVISEEGFGTPPITYVTDQTPFQHGNTVRSFTLEPRPVQLIISQEFCSRSAYWNGRALLLDTVRPNRITNFAQPGSLLAYLANNSKRQLDVVLESGPGFAPPQSDQWREWSFTEALRFVAHDPAWYDPAVQTVLFTSGTLATFPITFPVVFSGNFGGVASFAYAGTWLEYPTFVVTGPITGLRIKNQATGVVLSLSYTLPAGYTATVVLRGTKSIIRSDGLNLLNYLTSDSDLTNWSLVPDPTAPGGINPIEITGSGADVNTAVTMTYYKRYFGI